MERLQPSSVANEKECKQKAKVDWSSLPQEIWLTIFGYIPQAELYFNVCQVCKRWNKLCRDITLWKNIDFNKMHDDITLAEESHHNLDFPIDLTEQDFEIIIGIFREYIFSIKLSRYNNDHLMYANKASEYLSICTNLRTLDVGFLDYVDLKTLCCHCVNLESIILEGCSCLDDDDFTNISLLQNLRRLHVNYCFKLTNHFLTYLYDLPNLRAINCDGVMSVKGSGLLHFFRRQPLMEELILDGDDMEDDIVEFATSNLPNLTVFELSFSESLTRYSAFEGKYKLESLKLSKAPDIPAAALCKVFSSSTSFNLKCFTITESSTVDDSVLTAISRCCPNLKLLNVDWCWGISDKGVTDIVDNCKKMARLSLLGLCINFRGENWLNELEKRLPHLIFLDLSNCNDMPDDELVELVRRKPSLEVYTYYRERVVVKCESEPIESPEPNNNTVKPIKIWKCPGEEGAEVIF